LLPRAAGRLQARLDAASPQDHCSCLPQRSDGACDGADDPVGHSLTPLLVSRAMTDAPQNDPAMPKMRQYAPIASRPTTRLMQYPDASPTAMANTNSNRSPASHS
jgi:hypothetical protein